MLSYSECNPTDINKRSYIFKYTPLYFHKYISLMRLDRPIGTWLVLIPTLQGYAITEAEYIDILPTMSQLLHILILCAGSIIVRSLGCVINDIIDRSIDSKVQRTKDRPLASGEMQLHEAIICAIMLAVPSILMLILLGEDILIAGIIAACFIIIYPMMKRIIPFPQLVLGIVINWGVIIGWLLSNNHIELAPLIILYVASIFWTLGYDTIYAYQDIDDDDILKVGSTARMIRHCPMLWISIFNALYVILYGLSLLYISEDIHIWIIIYIICSIQVVINIRSLNIHSPKQCNKVFRRNKNTGLLMLLATLLV